jgi:hypothetical protein
MLTTTFQLPLGRLTSPRMTSIPLGRLMLPHPSYAAERPRVTSGASIGPEWVCPRPEPGARPSTGNMGSWRRHQESALLRGGRRRIGCGQWWSRIHPIVRPWDLSSRSELLRGLENRRCRWLGIRISVRVRVVDSAPLPSTSAVGPPGGQGLDDIRRSPVGVPRRGIRPRSRLTLRGGCKPGDMAASGGVMGATVAGGERSAC